MNYIDELGRKLGAESMSRLTKKKNSKLKNNFKIKFNSFLILKIFYNVEAYITLKISF